MDSNNVPSSDHIFDVIEQLSSMKPKEKAARLPDYLKPYLKAAYDPYRHYFTKRKETAATASRGHGQFDDDVWYLLERLSQRVTSGVAAQVEIDKLLANLTTKSARLFIRILNKDLRIGMAAKSINKVFPGLIPTHDIMLAYRIKWGRVSYPAYVSPKIDGVRATFKKGQFISRGGFSFEGLEVLEQELSGITQVLDGELIIPGLTFQVSSGMIRSSDPTPNAVFHIFELPTLKESFPMRVEMMGHLDSYSNHVKSVPQILCSTEKQIKSMYDEYRSLGYEGAIVRPYDYDYVGSRSFNWMKVKPLMKDLELTIVGRFEGEGKYEGMLGGFEVVYNGSKGPVKVKVGTGFTDYQRVVYWDMPEEDFKYSFAQVEAMEETDDGSLRHPVFKELKD